MSYFARDLFHGAVRGCNFMDSEVMDAQSRLEDCAFVYRMDWALYPGSTHIVFLYKGSTRKESEITVGSVLDLSKIRVYAVRQRQGIDEGRLQEYSLKSGVAREDKDNKILIKLRLERFLENIKKIPDYRLTLASANKRAKALALKKAREVAEKEDVKCIEDIIRM
jgi:hypothetical protein